MNPAKLLIFVLVLLVGALAVEAATCCTNPNVPDIKYICADYDVGLTDCCKPEESHPEYYSGVTGSGPSSYTDCAGPYFFESTGCGDDSVLDCSLGCCCEPPEPLPLRQGKCIPRYFKDGEGCAATLPDGSSICSDIPIPGKCDTIILLPEQVTGEKKIELTWDFECDVSGFSFELSRCTGTGTLCTTGSFKSLGTFSSTVSEYTDDDPDLKWGILENSFGHYVYKIDVITSTGTSASYTAPHVYIGHVECQNQNADEFFCIDQDYYSTNGIKEYLINEEDTLVFTETDFDEKVADVFEAARFNNAYTCNKNKLINEKTCTGGTCRITGGQHNCMKTAEGCELIGAPFNLFANDNNPADENTCDFGDSEADLCFYDLSETQVYACYNCDPNMECYDYKSKNACEKDKDTCKIAKGKCEWHDIDYNEFLSGVCVDTGIDNCEFHNEASSSDTIENSNVFNQRLEEYKIEDLSVDDYQCMADWCNDEGCVQYKTKESCNKNALTSAFPQSNWILEKDEDNNIITTSKDACGVNVCRWFDSGKCQKDANLDGTEDCSGTDAAMCEKDYFPPITKVTDDGANLIFSVEDQRKLGETPADVTGTSFDANPDYVTKVCREEPKVAGVLCESGAALELRRNNYNQEYPKKNLAESSIIIANQPNTLKFYTEDPNGNLEVAQRIVVEVYDNKPQIMLNPVDSPVSQLPLTISGEVVDNNFAITGAGIRLPDGSSQSLTLNAPYNSFSDTISSLPEGSNTITVWAQNENGMEGTANAVVLYDKSAPIVISSNPAHDETVDDLVSSVSVVFGDLSGLDPEHSSISLSGTTSEGETIEITAEEATVDITDTTITMSLATALGEGIYTVEVTAQDNVGNSDTIVISFIISIDNTPPSVALDPPDKAIRNSVFFIEAELSDEKSLVDQETSTISVSDSEGTPIEGTPAVLPITDCEENWDCHLLKYTPDEAIDEAGDYTINLHTADSSGNSVDIETTFTVDLDAPVIEITSPEEGHSTGEKVITIRGTITDPVVETATLWRNEMSAGTFTVTSGTFETTVDLLKGENRVQVSAEDSVGNAGNSGVRNIFLDVVGPVGLIDLITD
ncbi:MAG: hypothetical protein GY861_07405 [bacterium]|nr:hypothetical protein [bacterium]